jgi:hypothetical protein
MAVRNFELTEPQTTRLLDVGLAPKRRELRRSKQRYALVGALVVAVPFFTALIVLGAAH